jgi:8-oxo-dGTP pyrophosphatase MutT (NUDIX family)
MTRVIRAGVVLTNFDSSKILVVVNNDAKATETKFGLPKGHLEEGENIFECAVRELKEETGIIVRISPKDPKIIIAQTTYYLLKARGQPQPIPQDGTEILYSRWVTWDEICVTDCNRGLRAVRERFKGNGSFKRQIYDLKARSVGIVRRKEKVKQENEEKYSSGHERSGEDTCDSESTSGRSYDERPEDV